MNIVQFALRLQDLASGPMQRFGETTRRTLEFSSQRMNELRTRNKMVALSYNEIQAKIKTTEDVLKSSVIPNQLSAARRELLRLQAQAGRIKGGTGSERIAAGGGGRGGMVGMMGGVGGMMTAGALAAFGAAATKSISSAMERGAVQTSFNVLVGGEAAGSELTKQLVELQKNTILGGEVFENARTMLGFGASAKEVAADLRMLGDVSMGNKDRLGSLTLAFSQVRAAGKLTGQDLLQFINAGFNPLQSIAEKTGKSMGELRKEVEAGRISFTDVKQAFMSATGEGGKFENMLGKIAETPMGKLARLKGATGELFVKLGEAIMPLWDGVLRLAEAFLPIVERLIPSIAAGVQSVVVWIKEAFAATGGWTEYLEGIRILFMSHVLPVVQRLWQTITHIVSKLVDFIGKSELLRDIFKAIGIIVAGVFDFTKSLIYQLHYLFEDIVMPILRGIEAAYRFVKGSRQENWAPTAGTTAGAELVAANPQQELKQQESAQLLTQIASNTADNMAVTKDVVDGIKGGGPKVVNFHIQKFFDNINITNTTGTDIGDEIERTVLQVLGRVVAQGAATS